MTLTGMDDSACWRIRYRRAISWLTNIKVRAADDEAFIVRLEDVTKICDWRVRLEDVTGGGRDWRIKLEDTTSGCGSQMSCVDVVSGNDRLARSAVMISGCNQRKWAPYSLMAHVSSIFFSFLFILDVSYFISAISFFFSMVVYSSVCICRRLERRCIIMENLTSL